MSAAARTDGPEAPALPAGPAWAVAAARVLDRAVGFLCALSLAAMIGVVFAAVVARYVFNSSFNWSEELALWLFVYVIFLGMPLALRRRMHLSLSLFDHLLAGPWKVAHRFLVDAVVAYTAIVLALGGWGIVQVIGGVSPALELPVWIRFAVVPAGAAVALLYLVLREAEEGGSPLLPLAAVAAAAACYLAFNHFQLAALPRVSPSLVASVAFLGTMVLGVPVAFAMMFGVFLARLAGAPLPEPAIVQMVVSGASKFVLLAVPFFLAAGVLMNAGRLTERLIGFARALVGHLRGGLGQVTIVTSLMFSGISGSSISEAAIGSKLLVPELERNGYPRPVACAMVAASAVLPNIIPPSVALLIMAAAVNLSVGDLWLAGVVPGILLGGLLMVAVWAVALRRGYGLPQRRATLGQVGRASVAALPVLFLAVIILAGIRFGVVTPTESGVLAVVYALVLGLFVYRLYGVREMWGQLERCAVEAALVGLLIGAAAPFAILLLQERIPAQIVALVTGWTRDPLLVLLLLNLVLLLFGMILDIGVGIIVLTPLMMPLATSVGIDPIHFGIVVCVNLMLGGLTPPVGMLVFVSSSVARVPAHQVFRAVLPFLGALLVGLVLVNAVPALSLALIR
jgi:tripartite ATP-independent transporter DctM subunit